MKAIAAANLLLKFLLELASIAAFALWGATAGNGAFAVLLAIVAPVVAATLWGRYAAPRAANRLSRRARIAFELAVFILASAAFLGAGQSLAAAVLLVATAVNCLLLTAFHQWEG